MLLLGSVLVICILNVHSVVQNVTCPVVSPRELDWKDLDGKWYIAAIASEHYHQGDCAVVIFSHKTDNTTNISISYINNNTASIYNGSVSVSFDPNSNSSTDGDLLVVTFTDQKVETYTFLDVDYEHYAVMFSCYNNDDGNSSNYEVWELTRGLHTKPKHVTKIFNALSKYNLQDTVFVNFNNSDDNCKVNAAKHLHTSSLVLGAAVALSVLIRLY